MAEIEGLLIKLDYLTSSDADELVIYEPDGVPILNESDGYHIRNPVCWEVLVPA